MKRGRRKGKERRGMKEDKMVWKENGKEVRKKKALEGRKNGRTREEKEGISRRKWIKRKQKEEKNTIKSKERKNGN